MIRVMSAGTMLRSPTALEQRGDPGRAGPQALAGGSRRSPKPGRSTRQLRHCHRRPVRCRSSALPDCGAGSAAAGEIPGGHDHARAVPVRARQPPQSSSRSSVHATQQRRQESRVLTRSAIAGDSGYGWQRGRQPVGSPISTPIKEGVGFVDDNLHGRRHRAQAGMNLTMIR